jgi:phospholipid-binding lipoprotein MlaA
VLGGCGSLSGAVRTDSALLAESSRPAAIDAPSGADFESADLLAADAELDPTEAVLSSGVGAGKDGAPTLPMIAQTERAPADKPEPVPAEKPEPEGDEEYDPFEKFNEVMFEVNRQLDRFVLKPVAQVYRVIVPEPFEILIANAFDNIAFVPRAGNSLLQGKWGGTARELGRFLINSTLGIGGLFDAARYWGIEKSREDFGQTLGVWGVPAGPYLVLPLMEPMTIRDGIGRGVDAAMNPLTWVGPAWWISLTMKAAETVNDRALNLELFQGLEESVVDLYSAVRNGYLRRREQMIKE